LLAGPVMNGRSPVHDAGAGQVAVSDPAGAGQRLRVPLSLGERSYDILIGNGLLDEAGPLIAALGRARAASIVADRNTGPLYLKRLQAGLAAAGLKSASVVIAPGESSKSYASFEEVCEAILAAKIGRDDLVIALGGGVVGDLAGFAAASVRRGVRLVQVPT